MARTIADYLTLEHLKGVFGHTQEPLDHRSALSVRRFEENNVTNVR
jgi:hypothetical protein